MPVDDLARFQFPPQLADLLTELYRSEINVHVTASSFFDAGWSWTIQLGDHLNGFDAERDFDNAEFQRDSVSWLTKAVNECYPTSDFVRRVIA